MATNNAINVGLSGATGTGSFVGSIGSTVTSPRMVTSILDTNGNILFGLTPAASAVNYLQYTNAAAGGTPTFTATGASTDIAIAITSKGIGGVTIKGTGTSDSATAGFVGEMIFSNILVGSAVSLTTGVSADITSILLTPGDYDVWANVTVESTATLGQVTAWTSSTSASPPDGAFTSTLSPAATSSDIGMSVPYRRYSLSSTTTIYLSVNAAFTVVGDGYGSIYARRAR